MTPRHPPRALGGLTTPTENRIPQPGGPGRKTVPGVVGRPPRDPGFAGRSRVRSRRLATSDRASTPTASRPEKRRLPKGPRKLYRLWRVTPHARPRARPSPRERDQSRSLTLSLLLRANTRIGKERTGPRGAPSILGRVWPARGVHRETTMKARARPGARKTSDRSPDAQVYSRAARPRKGGRRGQPSQGGAEPMTVERSEDPSTWGVHMGPGPKTRPHSALIIL